MNEVVKDLKETAAKLGANGVLLQGVGEKSGDVVGFNVGQTTNTGANGFNNTTSFYSADTHKTGRAIAIYVAP